MDMFSGDTTKIDGIVYSHSSFGYPVGMSLPALQKQVGYWADTFSQIAKYSFFRSQDFGVADSQLLKIFSDNGNSVGLINGVSSVASAKMILTDVSSYTYYGWKDSLDRQKTVDSLFHFVSVLRQKNRNDSVFIGASVSGFKSGYVDSIKKYPQLVGGFDGLAISFNIYDLRNMSNVSQYVDSMVGVLQARLPGKSLIMIMDVWALDCASGDQDMPIYEAFKKAKAKYGFALVLSNISNFYVSLSAVTVVPSPMYKYLMPWRFPSAVSCFGPSLQKQRSVLCVINQKIVIGNAKTAASLSVYSLSGRLVRQLSIKRNSTFDMRLSGLPAGNFIYKLKAGEESLMGKFLLSR
jgi:hypothetical protein